jgi:hypothetical protein
MADKKSFEPFGSLIYPDDGNADNFYPDCVCFTIQKRVGVSIDDVTGAATAAMTAASGAWNFDKLGDTSPAGKALQKTIKEIDNKEQPDKAKRELAVKAAIDTYTKAGGKAPENMFDVITAGLGGFTGSMAKKQLALKGASAEVIGSIYLNMPNGIQFNESANWSGQELGFMGKMAQNLVTGGGEGDAAGAITGAVAGGAGSMVGAAVGAIPSLVSKLGIKGGMFGMAIGAMAAGSPIQKGFESALGVAQNPYMEMMFSGIGFREFQFEFILRPKDIKEVKTVSEILRMLRTFTKPTFSEGKLGKSFMDYPMEFGIKFLTGVGDTNFGTSFTNNTNIPKLKTCVCSNVTSNFTPQSIWAAHKGGVPLAVTLGLSFKETELVMAEDVYDEQY